MAGNIGMELNLVVGKINRVDVCYHGISIVCTGMFQNVFVTIYGNDRCFVYKLCTLLTYRVAYVAVVTLK